MDSKQKLAIDYAVAGIVLGGEYKVDRKVLYVERDGRRIFESSSEREIAMFAEELFERLLVARRMVQE